MGLHFYEFIRQEKSRLERFEEWWIKMNKKFPENFPMEMMDGDWDEQLNMYNDNEDLK